MYLQMVARKAVINLPSVMEDESMHSLGLKSGGSMWAWGRIYYDFTNKLGSSHRHQLNHLSHPSQDYRE